MKIKLAAITLALAACISGIIVTSCGADDVGIPCVLKGLPAQLDVKKTITNSQAMDCRSRICMLFSSKTTSDAVCTTTCDDDGDCSDAHSGDQTSCQQGFICRIASTVTGNLPCCKICVCKDRYSDTAAIDAEFCQGKAAVCPF